MSKFCRLIAVDEVEVAFSERMIRGHGHKLQFYGAITICYSHGLDLNFRPRRRAFEVFENIAASLLIGLKSEHCGQRRNWLYHFVHVPSCSDIDESQGSLTQLLPDRSPLKKFVV